VLPVSLSDVSSGEPGVNSSGSRVAIGVGLLGSCGVGPPPPRRPLPADVKWLNTSVNNAVNTNAFYPIDGNFLKS
jgi:hypothetical protein